MKITIIYDNTTRDRRLMADWGFACLVESGERIILFDTGANGNILLTNMKYLGINPNDITDIFISHDHWDHTGGLSVFKTDGGGTCFVPEIFSVKPEMPTVRMGKAPQEIYGNIWTTGTLAGIEQALVVKQDDQATVVTGCAHPGVETILAAGGGIAPVTALIGGLHGFDNVDALTGMRRVCPTHCSQHIDAIRRRHGDIFVEGGAGGVIEL